MFSGGTFFGRKELTKRSHDELPVWLLEQVEQVLLIVFEVALLLVDTVTAAPSL